FHRMAGDTLADRLTPRPVPPGVDSSKVDYHEFFPPALALEWDKWFDTFVKHYDLDEEQRREAATRLEQRKSDFVRWVLTHKLTIDVSTPGGTISREQGIAEWIETYRNKQKEVREYIAGEYRERLGTSYESEAKAHLAALRREVNEIRAALKRALAEQT